jgi:hypothetical protein
MSTNSDPCFLTHNFISGYGSCQQQCFHECNPTAAGGKLLYCCFMTTPWSRLLLEKLTVTRSYSRNVMPFMDPEDSLPNSKEPASSPYPNLNNSSPHPINLFLYAPFYYYLPIYTQVFQVASSLRFSIQNDVRIS